ncbi:MAG: ASKHA domain-containing protein [Clostridiales Family XIII bacterium]|nr:ASKHA domain-containing protein [Clostridiales Family XIII bacterium]
MADDTIKIKIAGGDRVIEASQGANLLTCLQENGIPVAADCGGRGQCGKCLVRVAPIADEGVIAGIPLRLACTYRVTKDICVLVPEPREDDIVVTGFSLKDIASYLGSKDSNKDGNLGVAVDVGTTTIFVKLIDLTDGRELASKGFSNPQRAFGADVISRIEKSKDDAGELSKIITEKIDSEIADLLAETVTSKTSVKRIVISGNTAMTYILLGLRCASLADAPFVPEYEIGDKYNYAEIFKTDTLDCECIVVPFASSFIGGDVLSGLVYIDEVVCPVGEFMLMDLGTNGEIVYSAEGKTMMTSAAAGPALEGGYISCGMSAVPGAIYSVARAKVDCRASLAMTTEERFAVEVIGSVKAEGLCGSGIIDLMACLLRGGSLTKGGSFASSVSSNGVSVSEDIRLLQEDVREFQLAKSAIRSGAEILIRENDGKLPERLYISGGFGLNLNIDNAQTVGLLPEVSKENIVFIGNSSIEGAALICQKPELLERVKEIAKDGISLNLAEQEDFEDKFVENITF